MEKKRGIDSFTLHILAMLFMLCDHLWATLFPAQEWMTCVGRLAFPIFAFMIAEGCYYTSNVKKYMLRLFLFAIISEIPFNLIMGSSVFYPFHQNVLWTFLLGVLSIQIIEKATELAFLPTALSMKMMKRSAENAISHIFQAVESALMLILQ